ncbi:MAG: ComEC/Rec2 family competence protein [Ruminococcaceae bacterium]|nr:ComEC/Rec2 family competence protein [Oscillospiraceae bacterium]
MSVKIAPPMAAGMLLAFLFGDVASVISIAVLIFVTVFLVSKRNTLCICTISAVFGIASMLVWIKSVALPVARISGETVTTEIEVTDVTLTRDGVRLMVAHGKINGIDVIMGLVCSDILEEGQRVIATIDVTEPVKNDMVFVLSNGILLEGEITEFIPVSSGGRRVSRAIKALRRGLFNDFLSSGSGDSQMLMQSMLLGIDNGLSASLEDNMRVCGALHYTAVSGAHFAILSAALLEMVSEDRRRVKSVFSLVLAFSGILFFGPTKSVIRASTMFFIGGLAGFFKRRADTLNSLCVTIILITVFRPQNILDVGFAMSVMGVFGAGVVGPKLADRLMMRIPERAEWLNLPVRAMTISISAVLCTAPLSAAIFGGVSMLGAVVTLILAPLMVAAMVSMAAAAVTGLWVFTVPIEWSMRIAAATIRFFGKWRLMYINMDSVGSWLFPLACAVLISIAAFGRIRLFKPMIRCTVISLLCSLVIAQEMIFNRHEIRFVGDYVTSAAVIMRGSTAAVYISGGGGGLADDISQCLRAHGAVNVVCIAAPNADYSGSLALRELSEMVKIDVIYANELTEKLLPELPVVAAPEADMLVVGNLSVGSATVSDVETAVDIVLYRGRMLNPPQTPARLAVYFLPDEAEIPENGVNICADKDFKVDLPAF